MNLKYFIFSVLAITSMACKKKIQFKGHIPGTGYTYRTEEAKYPFSSLDLDTQKIKIASVSMNDSLNSFSDSIDSNFIDTCIMKKDEVALGNSNIELQTENKDCYQISNTDSISGQFDILLENKIIEIEKIYKQKLLLRIRSSL